MKVAEVLDMVWATDVSGAADELDRWVKTRKKGIICLANVHVVETARCDPELYASIRASDMVLADGAPVAWAVRTLCGRAGSRVAGSEFFDEVCRRSRGRYRHYFFGSTPDVLLRLEAQLEKRYPGIEICGRISPPFRPLREDETAAVYQAINAARPDIVWVGLGAPKQELWMARARSHLDVPVVAGIGAVFDFAAGTKRRAPVWMRRSGLEWLHRLSNEPTRLWKRYLTTNASFTAAVARMLLVRNADRSSK